MADSAVPSRRSISGPGQRTKRRYGDRQESYAEWLSQRGRSGGSTTRDLYSANFFRHAQEQRKIRRGWPQGKMRSNKIVQVAKQAIENSGLSSAATQLLTSMLAQG